MTIITCDLCKKEILLLPIRVKVRDGEHPHKCTKELIVVKRVLQANSMT